MNYWWKEYIYKNMEENGRMDLLEFGLRHTGELFKCNTYIADLKNGVTSNPFYIIFTLSMVHCYIGLSIFTLTEHLYVSEFRLLGISNMYQIACYTYNFTFPNQFFCTTQSTIGEAELVKICPKTICLRWRERFLQSRKRYGDWLVFIIYPIGRCTEAA